MLAAPHTFLLVKDLLAQDFEDYGSDVVVRGNAVGKIDEAVEEVIQGFGGGFGMALSPEFCHAIRTEFGPLAIQRFVKTVGGEKNGISGRELNDVLVVTGDRKQAGRKSASSKRLA
jgi:predicted SpoU family rRNA methylase